MKLPPGFCLRNTKVYICKTKASIFTRGSGDKLQFTICRASLGARLPGALRSTTTRQRELYSLQTRASPMNCRQIGSVPRLARY